MKGKEIVQAIEGLKVRIEEMKVCIGKGHDYGIVATYVDSYSNELWVKLKCINCGYIKQRALTKDEIKTVEAYRSIQ